MLDAHDHEPTASGRSRRRIRIELRPIEHLSSAEELCRREQELERLIIKAACRRAARLAQQFGEAHNPAVGGR